MTIKKTSRGRIEIATDIYRVLNKKISKKHKDNLLKPLFKEMTIFEQRLARTFKRAETRLAKQPESCSTYEIFHGRGCGKCSSCLTDLGERFYPNIPKFLK
jgi:hypothetical protein